MCSDDDHVDDNVGNDAGNVAEDDGVVGVAYGVGGVTVKLLFGALLQTR